MKKKIRYIEEIYIDKYRTLYQVIQIDVDYELVKEEIIGDDKK